MNNIYVALVHLFARLTGDTLGWMGLVVGCFGLGYAAMQKYESSKLLRYSGELKAATGDLERNTNDLKQNTKRHADEMESQRATMEKLTVEMTGIVGAMSTKYVGGFPKNIVDICEVVSSADNHLDIQVDLVAYGHYSNPDGFKRYIDRIEDLAKRLPQPHIRILVYVEETARRVLESQFGGPDEFPEEMASERYRRYFRELYKDEPPATSESFINYLVKVQREWRERIQRYKAVELRFAGFPFRLFLWIEDQEEAVFAFEMYGRNRTISFRTRDGNLINTFHTVFEQNWQECAPRAVPELEKKPAQNVQLAS